MKAPFTVTLKKGINTDQDAFDAACKHLAKQKCKAYNRETEACKYWTSDGRRCAVGALVTIPMAKQMEREYGGSTITSSNFFVASDISTRMLQELQWAHDGADSLEHLHSRLRTIAGIYRVDDSKVDLITEFNAEGGN